MKFPTLAALLLSLSVAASASPVEARVPVLICTGSDGGGQCEHQTYGLERCYQLQPPVYHNAKTFAIDDDRFSCFPRITDCDDLCTSPSGCSLGAVDAHYQYRYNMSQIHWDGILASFDCFRKTGAQ